MNNNKKEKSMNIILLLNNDIASNFALNLLLPSLTSHNISVFLSSKVGGNKARPALLQQLSQFEQQDAFLSLAHQQRNNSRKHCFKSYNDLASDNNIAIETLNEINTKSGVAKIQALSPDLIISIRYGVILQKDVINLAQYGVINLHSGKLPNYRGVMATFWAMLNGDKTLEATLHYISDNTIDTGGIIASSAISVQTEKSYLWHVLSLYIDGCKLIEQAINTVNTKATDEVKGLRKGVSIGNIDAITKAIIKSNVQTNEGNYYSFPSSEELAVFIAKFGYLYQEEEVVALVLSKILSAEAATNPVYSSPLSIG